MLVLGGGHLAVGGGDVARGCTAGDDNDVRWGFTLVGGFNYT